MGCDYYIIKLLEIALSNGVAYIEVSCSREYFKDPDYESKSESDEMEVYYTPKLIFENGEFVNEHYEDKYSQMLNDKITSGDKYSNDTEEVGDIRNIMSIYKIEVRYER